jgi:hypothetical protein
MTTNFPIASNIPPSVSTTIPQNFSTPVQNNKIPTGTVYYS